MALNEPFGKILSTLQTDIFVINKLILTHYNVTNKNKLSLHRDPQVISPLLILIFYIRFEMDALPSLVITKA